MLKTSFKLKSEISIDQRLSHPFDAVGFLVLVFLTVFSFQTVFIHSVSWAQADMTKVDMRAIDGNFHLEFSGAKEWDYDLERKESFGKIMVELRVPSLAPKVQDLFAKIPPNEVVESIFFEKVNGGAKDIITITLKADNVESFDYLTEKPSRLVIDFYQVKSIKKSLAQSDKKKKNEKSLPAQKPNTEGRKPAADEYSASGALVPPSLEKPAEVSNLKSDEDTKSPILDTVMSGIFDGGDPQFERFSIKDYEINPAAIIRSEENLYIPFPMREMDGVHYEQLMARAPAYEIIPKQNDENKMARLALTLFEKNRLSVALKTTNWFFDKYPTSDYEEILRFVKGDIFFKRWNQLGNRTDYELALQAYREALIKFPKSLLGLRTQFLIGYAQFANKDFFGSLKTFQKVVQEQKPSEVRDRAQLAVARALLKIHQYDDALVTYDSLQKAGSVEANRIEAAYLKGDVQFAKKDYLGATESYSFATKKMASSAQSYPSGFFNLAESLFWQKRYRESLDSYRDYLTRFPRDSHAPYAMTRVGEVLEVLGADPQRSTGAFLETYFRYGGTSGASVARMRLLSRRMGGMKTKESEKAIEEMDKIATDFPLPQIDLLTSLLGAEGLSARGSYEVAINRLLKWYQSNSSTRDVTLIKKRIIRHVNEEMADAVAKGDFVHVLKVHDRYSDLWLRGSERIDTIYNLAKAFELGGANKQANSLFLEAINKLVESKISAEGRKHSVFERLPTLDQLNLRLAKVSFELNNLTKALNYMKEIKKPLELSEDEQIERMELSVDLLKAKGDLGTAKVYLRDLIKNWKGQAAKTGGLRIRLAEYELEDKDADKAAMILEENRNDLADSQKIPSEDHFKTLTSLSDVYHAAGKSKDNESVLNELLEKYPEASSLGGYRYRLGKIHFEAGNLQKAKEVWGELEKKGDKFWWGLASNQLKESNWSESYKKYIDRIPAMDGFKQKGVQ